MPGQQRRGGGSGSGGNNEGGRRDNRREGGRNAPACEKRELPWVGKGETVKVVGG